MEEMQAEKPWCPTSAPASWGLSVGSKLYDPGWHDPDTLYPCPACHGTGERKDQVLF